MLINQQGQLTTHGPSRTEIRQQPKDDETKGEGKAEGKSEAKEGGKPQGKGEKAKNEKPQPSPKK
jgi:hypothetical protein